jgi:hypothetical protein
MNVVDFFCVNINFTTKNDVSLIDQLEFVKFIVLYSIKKILPIILREVDLNEEANQFLKINNLSDIRELISCLELEKKYICLYHKIVHAINNARGFQLNSIYESDEYLSAVGAIIEMINLVQENRFISKNSKKEVTKLIFEICTDALTKCKKKSKCKYK